MVIQFLRVQIINIINKEEIIFTLFIMQLMNVIYFALYGFEPMAIYFVDRIYVFLSYVRLKI